MSPSEQPSPIPGGGCFSSADLKAGRCPADTRSMIADTDIEQPTMRAGMDKALQTPSLEHQIIGTIAGQRNFDDLIKDDAKLREAMERALSDIGALGNRLGCGTSRVAFEIDGLVVKAPRVSGINGPISNCYSNLCEVASYELDVYAGPVVPCRIAWHETGIPLVVMETIDCDVPYEDLPDWAGDVDSEQVAWSLLLDDWACYDAGFAPYSMLTDDIRELRGAPRLKAWIDLMNQRAAERDKQTIAA